MKGTFGFEEYLGQEIYNIGDCNHDNLNDWIVQRNRTDTAFRFAAKRYPRQLFLFKGRPDSLPTFEDGIQIGATELGSYSRLLASGDFNADGNVDLVCRIDILTDSINRAQTRLVGHVVILWGSPNGMYSINDTLRLTSGGIWDYTIIRGGIWDCNNDRIDDIVIQYAGGNALDASGAIMKVPELHVYYGRTATEWKERPNPHIADFVWWNPPTIDTLMNHLVDIDCDDQADLVFLGNSQGVGSISTLYGSGSFPDTTAVVTIGYDSIKGMSTLLTDITGDNLVDFIILSDRFANQRMRVYPGEPGKRLHELISDDPLSSFPRSFRWKQPWAAVPTPFWFDEGWGDVGTILFDGGDGNQDGVKDIWALSVVGSIQVLVCYGTAGFLDSLIDGQFSQLGGLYVNIVSLGVVDGSGLPVTALSYRTASATGIYYLQWNPTIPQSGRVRTLPHTPGEIRCNSAVSVEERGRSKSETHIGLSLTVSPNPTRQIALIACGSCYGFDPVDLIVYDATGQNVEHGSYEFTGGNIRLDLRSLSPGWYRVVLRQGQISGSHQIILIR